MTSPESSRLPRATLKQKLEVLDWQKGPPWRSQSETLDHFRKQGKFGISQATLSTWMTREGDLRRQAQNPLLFKYRRAPVMKYPDVTRAVERHLKGVVARDKDVLIKDSYIKDTFKKFMKEFGHEDPEFKISAGMLCSFKRRNRIHKGRVDAAIEQSDLEDEYSLVPRIAVSVSQDNQLEGESQSPTSAESIQPQSQPQKPQNQQPQPQPEQPTIPIPPSQALQALSPYTLPQQSPEMDLAFEEIFSNSSIGFNTRLIHSDDNISSLLNNFTSTQLALPNNSPSVLDFNQPQPAPPPPQPLQPHTHPHAPPHTHPRNDLPYYPTFQDPLQSSAVTSGSKRPYLLDHFTFSKTSHPNSEKVEMILENITNGKATLYNSGTSAIMGILAYLKPPKICINESGYQGTHRVINLLSKLAGMEKLSLEEIDKLTPNSVVLIETPMNPEGYVLDISKYAKLAHQRSSFLLVDSTLAPPPLQFPFDLGADYVVYSAVKYLAGVSDLGAGFVVCKSNTDKVNLQNERLSLGTSIASFDSFLLLRSLRTYKMRILTQCKNTEKIVTFLRLNSEKYSSVILKLHHSSLQVNDFVKKQLNGYFNPVLAIEFKTHKMAEEILTKFNFLSNNPNTEGGETVVEQTSKNPNFVSSDGAYTKGSLLRFSIGCEDYQDIIRDIDQAMMSVTNVERSES